MNRVPTQRVLDGWRETIAVCGCARLKLRTLIRNFGFERRGKRMVLEVEQWLEQHGIYVMDLAIADLDEPVILTAEHVLKVGELVEYERDIEARFEHEMMAHLGLSNPQKEYRPRGTRDRIDVLCRDADGRSVAVELKRGAGQKRAVEQLLRYIGQLKFAGGHHDPRGILITGYADADTRRALQGRDRDEHIRWFVYGLVSDEVHLEEVRFEPRGGA
jgi:hypothetical protein